MRKTLGGLRLLGYPASVAEDMVKPEPKSWDARTTPKWLQWPLTLLFALTVIYLLACFHFTLRKERPRWVWFGYWQMFSVKSRYNAVVEMESFREGEWHTVDIPAIYPTLWESGRRFERSSFRRSKSRLRVLGASTCLRVDEPIEKLRIFEKRWRKNLGSRKQTKVTRKQLLEWPCDQNVALPNGRILNVAAERAARGKAL